MDKHIEQLIVDLDIKSWNPRVGDAVRRLEDGRPLGAIVGFEYTETGHWVWVAQYKQEPTRHYLPLLEPIDVLDAVRGANSMLVRALERIKKALHG